MTIRSAHLPPSQPPFEQSPGGKYPADTPISPMITNEKKAPKAAPVRTPHADSAQGGWFGHLMRESVQRDPTIGSASVAATATDW